MTQTIRTIRIATQGPAGPQGPIGAPNVTSVAGRTGVVTLTKSDVGLSNVPNTDVTHASNIASGTLPDSRLSSNVPLKNAANGWTALNTHSGGTAYDANVTFAGNGVGQLNDNSGAIGVTNRNIGIWSGGSNVAFFYKSNAGDGVLDVGRDNGSNSSPSIYLARIGATDLARWTAQMGNVMFGGILPNQKVTFLINGGNALQIDTDYALTGGWDGAGGMALVLRGGAASASNNGGDVKLAGGPAAGTNKNGGSIILQPSAKTGTGTDGVIQLLAALIKIGGLTSGFPALKRSSTTLQVRLADDSAFAPVQGKLTTDANAAAETITPDKTLTLYDASGVAYKVPCVAA